MGGWSSPAGCRCRSRPCPAGECRLGLVPGPRAARHLSPARLLFRLCGWWGAQGSLRGGPPGAQQAWEEARRGSASRATAGRSPLPTAHSSPAARSSPLSLETSVSLFSIQDRERGLQGRTGLSGQMSEFQGSATPELWGAVVSPPRRGPLCAPGVSCRCGCLPGPPGVHAK